MRKSFYLFCTVFSLLLLLQCTSGDKALSKKLNEMATELNESAPVMLDQYTRFDGASVVDDSVFQYRYTVLNTDDPGLLVENGVESLLENVRNEFSTNPQLAVFKENNVVVEYVYMDEKEQVIRSIRVNPEEYR